jgi:multiple sugar transport system substrate-binding protein
MSEKPLKKLTRRDMLKLSGTVAAGAVLASCSSPTPEPTEEAMPEEPAAEEEVVAEEPEAMPASGHVVCMHFLHEFTEDHTNLFMEKNPGITLEILDGEDPTRFFAMYAAGTPPDLYRVQAPSVPAFLARGLLYDCTPYFEASTVVPLDDLMPANDYYKAESPLEVGSGKIYGMVKDFSPDLTIFANKALFEDAGLPAPDDTKAMTYDEIMAISSDLTVFDGERLMQYAFAWENGWIDRYWENIMNEIGQSIWSEGFDKMVIAGNEDATAVVKWYYDMSEAPYTVSPQMPSPGGWTGNDFLANVLAMQQYGFWFSAMAESDDNRGDVVMLPGPTWSGVRNDRTITATGMIQTSDTQNPDAAWKVQEYYNGEEPSVARAGSGWGVPGLKSQLELVPRETDFQQQVFGVLEGELALDTVPIQFNPFVGENVVPNTWSKYLDQALIGDITFDELVTSMESEVNLAIQEGIDRIIG